MKRVSLRKLVIVACTMIAMSGPLEANAADTQLTAGTVKTKHLIRNGTDNVAGIVGTGKVIVGIGTGIVLPNLTKYYGITKIGIREQGNRPCHVTLWGGLLDAYTLQNGRLLGEVKLDRCGPEKPLWTPPDFKSASLINRNHRFVRGVNVCTNSPSPRPTGGGGVDLTTLGRLKGVRVLPAQVEPIAQVIERHVAAGFERKNCVTWDTAAVTCPAGEIVTSLVMHTIEDWFSGIEPRCQRVTEMAKPPGGLFRIDSDGLF